MRDEIGANPASDAIDGRTELGMQGLERARRRFDFAEQTGAVLRVDVRQRVDRVIGESGDVESEQLTRIAIDIRKAVRAVIRASQLEHDCGQRPRDVVKTPLGLPRARFGVADIGDVDHRADDARALSVRRRERTGPEQAAARMILVIAEFRFDLLPLARIQRHGGQFVEHTAMFGAPRGDLEACTPKNVFAPHAERPFEGAIHRDIAIVHVLRDERIRHDLHHGLLKTELRTEALLGLYTPAHFLLQADEGAKRHEQHRGNADEGRQQAQGRDVPDCGNR
ncbi:hypothetical protein AWB74_02773 [Caballeronia arvi]|uniref:Uncharacterized protein n=1 Tax=Caballeronia arvi TaxID=1777135 RepID=A0A158INW3_9BURK|nr:hypothetical protein AWB74_02773 [Caballeronia arvi]